MKFPQFRCFLRACKKASQRRIPSHAETQTIMLTSIITYYNYLIFLSSTKTSTIEVASLQAVYTDKDYPIKSSYRSAIQNYNVQPMEVDFYDRDTVHVINEATNRTTRGLIPYTVLPQDLYGAKMFLLSSLFFKGQWKVRS